MKMLLVDTVSITKNKSLRQLNRIEEYLSNEDMIMLLYKGKLNAGWYEFVKKHINENIGFYNLDRNKDKYQKAIFIKALLYYTTENC